MRISARSFCHAFIVWLAVANPAAALQSACSDDPRWQAPHDDGQVFYLQKSSNPNTVVYAMQFDDEGKLKRQKPMTAYWRRFAEHGQRMELRFLERILAFDIQYSVIDAAEPAYRANLVAYPAMKATVEKVDGGAYRAILPIGGQPALLDCIYIELRETDFIPKILHVDLVGRAVNGSEPVRQRLLPP
ncbi:MAG: DUF4833 domain-containing protein [Rhodobiaceae bacterium]|nr:DUF4833 domain-containing protein [Rhodobiaceae bacterium]MCC0054639.1 DUF4833 domain-containing protein [Rhodobiaceae bacterium]